MSTSKTSKTVSINTRNPFDMARDVRLKKVVAAVKHGIVMGVDEVRYLDSSMTPGERAAAVKAALAAATFTIGHNKVINVLTGALALDMSYQRDPRKGEQRLTRENFDMDKMDPLLVSYRDDILYVLDGSHRLAKAIDMGIASLPVKVLEGLNREQEAKIFTEQNNEKVTIKPVQKFKAGIVSKERTASIIYALCNSFGLEVTNKTCGVTRPMKAITAAVNIVENQAIDGPDCLCWILSLMNEARWFEDRKMLLGALTSHFMYGFMGVYTEGLREKDLTMYTSRLRKEMRKVSPELITSFGKLQAPNMDRRGYTKAVLKDIARGTTDAKDILKLALEENNQAATA